MNFFISVITVIFKIEKIQFDCPICGAQRSLLLLMQGDFDESFKLYPPLIFLLTLIFLMIAYLIFPNIIKAKFLEQYAVFVFDNCCCELCI
jgi:hypothetical protein